MSGRPGHGDVDAADARADLGWPDDKRFAFTIIDDTEGATLENVKPLYDLLDAQELRTTKTIWPLPFREAPRFGGQTLGDRAYRDWVVDLHGAGFELAFHGATDHSSPREDTERALDRFREVVGVDPRVHVNHFGQAEAVYWGDARLDGLPRTVYRATNTLLRRDTKFYGHEAGSRYFWGDLCRDRIEYVRNFTFSAVNTLEVDPLMPYHDPRRPYVRYWFSSSEAPTYDAFCALLSEENQDRLVETGGACVVYTHFAFGFTDDGKPKRRFAELVERLAGLQGWFVPVSTLLDHLRSRNGWAAAPDEEQLARLQRRWLLGRLKRGRL